MRHERVEQFESFVRAQPPERRYQYRNTEHCAIGRWHRSMGKKYNGHDMLLEAYAMDTPHTFGALAERLQGSEPRIAVASRLVSILFAAAVWVAFIGLCCWSLLT